MRIVEELVEIWSNEVCDTNQTSTALLTTALIIWLDYYLTGKIPNLDSLLKVTVTPLHVPTHNGAQHKVYTKKGTSNLLNTACL